MNGAELLVALVDSSSICPSVGDSLLKRIQPHYPTLPIMLVSIEDNGFKAYAAFQTGEILALLQLEELAFRDLDVDQPLPDQELPF